MLKYISLLALAIVLLCALPARAGTTGVLRGVVADSMTGRPLAGVTVTAASPAQTEKTVTDARGNYVFIDLVPGTYTLSVETARYEPVAVGGIPVQADTVQTVALHTTRRLTVVVIDFIGLPRNWLVHSGVTSDVYRIYTPGGGYASAPARTPYDSLRFVPGVVTAPGQPVQHR